MTKARDIMKTEFATVRPETTVEELGRIFIAKNVSGLSVTDEEGGLVGIVTENDLISSNKRLHIPTLLRLFDAIIPLEGSRDVEKEIRKMSATVVSEIFTRDPITISEDTPIEEIATIMTERKVHHLPVLRDGKLVGVVDQHCVIRGLAGEAQDKGA